MTLAPAGELWKINSITTPHKSISWENFQEKKNTGFCKFLLNGWIIVVPWFQTPLELHIILSANSLQRANESFPGTTQTNISSSRKKKKIEIRIWKLSLFSSVLNLTFLFFVTREPWEWVLKDHSHGILILLATHKITFKLNETWMHYKTTRMVMDGKYLHGLQTTNLKILGQTF